MNVNNSYYLLSAYYVWGTVLSTSYGFCWSRCSYCWCCSVTKSCLTLCNPVDYSTPGFPVLHYLPKFVQTHVYWVWANIEFGHPTISSSFALFSCCPQSFPASGAFPMSQLFTSGDQSIVASASASVLPVTIPSWFPLGLTGLISLQSKGLYGR